MGQVLQRGGSVASPFSSQQDVPWFKSQSDWGSLLSLYAFSSFCGFCSQSKKTMSRSIVDSKVHLHVFCFDGRKIKKEFEQVSTRRLWHPTSQVYIYGVFFQPLLEELSWKWKDTIKLNTTWTLHTQTWTQLSKLSMISMCIHTTSSKGSVYLFGLM